MRAKKPDKGQAKQGSGYGKLRHRLYSIIFKTDTLAGKIFDVALLWAIILSVIVVMLESVSGINAEFGNQLRIAEWTFTILFTLEYILRILVVDEKGRYIFSFLGVVDFLAIMPTYLSLFVPGSQYLVVIRTIRLLRVFRILKLTRYVGEANLIVRALKASRQKITVFLLAVLSLVIIMGTFMYLLEGPDNGFTNIPNSIYWAIITLTTVGYGDIVPSTFLGKILASVVMITGYAIIAVPTGIVTSEFVNAHQGNKPKGKQKCKACNQSDHDPDARYCKYCGKPLV